MSGLRRRSSRGLEAETVFPGPTAKPPWANTIFIQVTSADFLSRTNDWPEFVAPKIKEGEELTGAHMSQFPSDGRVAYTKMSETFFLNWSYDTSSLFVAQTRAVTPPAPAEHWRGIQRMGLPLYNR